MQSGRTLRTGLVGERSFVEGKRTWVIFRGHLDEQPSISCMNKFVPLNDDDDDGEDDEDILMLMMLEE